MNYHLDIQWILNSIISFVEYSLMRKNNIRKSSQISFNTSMASMNFAQADNFYERMTPLFGSRKLKKNKKQA